MSRLDFVFLSIVFLNLFLLIGINSSHSSSSRTLFTFFIEYFVLLSFFRSLPDIHFLFFILLSLNNFWLFHFYIFLSVIVGSDRLLSWLYFSFFISADFKFFFCFFSHSDLLLILLLSWILVNRRSHLI
jgi:hypothetical protein